ncbi:hypothetical protein GCM10009756_25860 [Pseudokineococcus marinus]
MGIGAEVGQHVEDVRLHVVVRVGQGARRPRQARAVAEGLLHVLGHLAGDVLGAARPRVEPPAPLADAGVDDVDVRGRAEAGGGQVVDDAGARLEEGRVRRRPGRRGPGEVPSSSLTGATTARP